MIAERVLAPRASASQAIAVLALARAGAGRT
jgi:hypothetical protein